MSTRLSTTDPVTGVLEVAGLPHRFADALDDDSWDQLLDAESEVALSRTGRDVGTPILTFQPPDGLSFFGPVISRVPTDAEAVELWDAVTTLAKFPGFAEMNEACASDHSSTSSGAWTRYPPMRTGRVATAAATSQPTVRAEPATAGRAHSMARSAQRFLWIGSGSRSELRCSAHERTL